MSEQYDVNIPRTNEPALQFELVPGSVVYMLGANGAGKSSLVSRLFKNHQAKAKRISAHRQTWFNSNTLDMTPRNRADLERNIRGQDAQDHARYRLDYGEQRAGIAIYDLIDSDTMLARKIAELVRLGDVESAKLEAGIVPPIQLINRLMRLSNIPIEIKLQERQKIVASKNGGPDCSVAELSDGERNAFLIAADVLTADPGAMLIIDEPERHLHRSIVSPLLKLLFDQRKDCVFIVSTHEIMLPIDTPTAATLLVRGCEYQGSAVASWTVDMLSPGDILDEDLKRDILGSRRRIIFVEGTHKSLDMPFYSLLFPQISVVPKDNCREVEIAVRGVKASSAMHWITAWSIVDNDQRSEEDVDRLRKSGVWALKYYSVESIYYHPLVIERIAKKKAALLGGDWRELVKESVLSAIEAAKIGKNHLLNKTVTRRCREIIMERLPNKNEIVNNDELSVSINVKDIKKEESDRFDEYITSSDWEALVIRYPMRESQAFDRIISALRFVDRNDYCAAVLNELKDDESALSEVREMLEGLYEEIIGT